MNYYNCFQKPGLENQFQRFTVQLVVSTSLSCTSKVTRCMVRLSKWQCWSSRECGSWFWSLIQLQVQGERLFLPWVLFWKPWIHPYLPPMKVWSFLVFVAEAYQKGRSLSPAGYRCLLMRWLVDQVRSGVGDVEMLSNSKNVLAPWWQKMCLLSNQV